MQFAADARAINNADVTDALAPSMDTNNNWIHTQRTPDGLVDSDSTSLDQLNLTHVNIQYVVD